MPKARPPTKQVAPGSAVRMDVRRDEKRPVEIAGIPFNVVSDAEAEQAEMVVCMPADAWSPFSDNLTAPCSQCGQMVIHRPHVPKKPAKVCITCAIPLTAPAAGRA